MSSGDETLTVKWTSWGNVWLAHYSKTGTIINDDADDNAPVTAPVKAPVTTPVLSARVTIADASASEGDAISFGGDVEQGRGGRLCGDAFVYGRHGDPRQRLQGQHGGAHLYRQGRGRRRNLASRRVKMRM